MKHLLSTHFKFPAFILSQPANLKFYIINVQFEENDIEPEIFMLYASVYSLIGIRSEAMHTMQYSIRKSIHVFRVETDT